MWPTMGLKFVYRYQHRQQQQWAANDDGKIQIKDALKVTKYTNKQTNNKRSKDGWRSLDGWMDRWVGGLGKQTNQIE